MQQSQRRIAMEKWCSQKALQPKDLACLSTMLEEWNGAHRWIHGMQNRRATKVVISEGKTKPPRIDTHQRVSLNRNGPPPPPTSFPVEGRLSYPPASTGYAAPELQYAPVPLGQQPAYTWQWSAPILDWNVGPLTEIVCFCHASLYPHHHHMQYQYFPQEEDQAL